MFSTTWLVLLLLENAHPAQCTLKIIAADDQLIRMSAGITTLYREETGVDQPAAHLRRYRA